MLNTIDILIDTNLLRSELREARKNKHLTQSQVAKLSGLSASTISNIESNEEKGVALLSIIKYARAVDCVIYAKTKPKKEE